MAFVKLDCGILDSTLWIDRTAREIFITALLMATPFDTATPIPTLKTATLDSADWDVPPGWYGFIAAAGPGIIRRSGIEHDAGMAALERLSAPEPESRSQEFDGRRLVRVDGGFIVLNFMRYREKDSTAADRMKRYRERKKQKSVTPLRYVGNATLRSDSYHAEAEAEVEVLRSKRELDPSGLDQEAWLRWEAYRKEIKKPLKPASIPAAKREMAAFGANQSATVEHSIANGYQGLFAPKRGKAQRKWE